MGHRITGSCRGGSHVHEPHDTRPYKAGVLIPVSGRSPADSRVQFGDGNLYTRAVPFHATAGTLSAAISRFSLNLLQTLPATMYCKDLLPHASTACHNVLQGSTATCKHCLPQCTARIYGHMQALPATMYCKDLLPLSTAMGYWWSVGDSLCCAGQWGTPSAVVVSGGLPLLWWSVGDSLCCTGQWGNPSAVVVSGGLLCCGGQWGFPLLWWSGGIPSDVVVSGGFPLLWWSVGDSLCVVVCAGQWGIPSAVLVSEGSPLLTIFPDPAPCFSRDSFNHSVTPAPECMSRNSPTI